MKKAAVIMKQAVAPLQANEVNVLRRKLASFDVSTCTCSIEINKFIVCIILVIRSNNINLESHSEVLPPLLTIHRMNINALIELVLHIHAVYVHT